MGKIGLSKLCRALIRLYLESNDTKLIQEALQVPGKDALGLEVEYMPIDIDLYFMHVCQVALSYSQRNH